MAPGLNPYHVPYVPAVRPVSKSSPLAPFFYDENSVPRVPVKVIFDEKSTRRGISFRYKEDGRTKRTNPLKPINIRTLTLATGTKLHLNTHPEKRLIGRCELGRNWRLYREKSFLDLGHQGWLPTDFRSWRGFLTACTQGNKFTAGSVRWKIDHEHGLIIQENENIFTITFEEFLTILSLIKMIRQSK